jgi:hypothetical protein
VLAKGMVVGMVVGGEKKKGCSIDRVREEQ